MTILVADIGGTAFKIGLVNLNGQLIEYHEYENDGKKEAKHLLYGFLTYWIVTIIIQQLVLAHQDK